jgi:succinoglycan biosynthesis transport protein ExoP
VSQLPGLSGVPLGDAADDQPVEVPRFLAALRRAWWLIALIVIPFTGVVLVLSLVLPKTYDATARLVVESPQGSLAGGDNDSMTRRLATIQTLLTSRDVLTSAAERLPRETADTLEDKVSASVDEVASIVDLEASDNDADGAAAIANTVAETFVEERRGDERERFAEARRSLQAALDRLSGNPGAAVEIAAIRQRLSELSVAELAAADELEIAEAARPADAPSSPLPVQNTVFAFFASTFLAILAVLGREALAPRLSGARELSRLTGLVPLVVLPSPRWRPRPRQAAEAYQTLAADVRLQLSDNRRVILVTSAHREEERSTVAEGLARALSDGGVPTLLVAADLRRPRLHERLGVPQAPGLAEVLNALEQGGDDDTAEVIRASVHAPRPDSGGRLRVLPSGTTARHPAALLSGDALGVLFDALARSRYRLVIVEGAPLMGAIDGQLLARVADAVLVVCRLDRLSPADAAELAEVLARVEAPTLGAVVIGGAKASYSVGASTPARTRSGVPGR